MSTFEAYEHLEKFLLETYHLSVYVAVDYMRNCRQDLVCQVAYIELNNIKYYSKSY